MSIFSKAKSAAKKFASNVVGGAKIVGSAIGKAVSSLGNTSQSANVLQSRTSSAPNQSRLPSPVLQSRVPTMTIAPNPRTGDPGGPGVSVSQGSFNSPTFRAAQQQGLAIAGAGGSPIYSAPTTLGGGQSRNSADMFADSSFSGSSPSFSATSISSSPSSISMPSAPSYANPGTINNAGLTSALADYGFAYDPATNAFTSPVQQQVSPEEERRIKEQRELMDMIPEKESVLDDRAVRRQQEEVNRRKQEVASYTSQLNNIVAQQNADLLRTRGTLSAEGGTEAVYGGIAVTINREAAIKALPVQAQVAAAQGNLELAQDYLTQLTTWKTEEINNKHEYKKAMFNSISEFVEGEQKTRLDSLEKKNDRQFELTKMNLSIQDSLAKEAAKDNPAAVSQIMALNPGSPNFRADMGKILASTGAGSGLMSDEASDNLTAYASQFADTGKLPSPAELKLAGLSVGDVTKYARQIPKQEGALVSVKTGVKSSALSPTQEDGILALYDISKKTAELKELEAKRVKGLTSATLGKVFGFKDQENYLNLRTEIVDLLSRARTGAALTASEEKFYADQLPGRVGQIGFGLFGTNTQNKINNFESKINGTLKTKLQGQDMAIYGYSKVKVGDAVRTVGEVLDINGGQYRVLPDGTLTDVF